ncbi:MAG: serine/threonine-protein kinase, partial [Chloroflexota bacterium]
MSFEVGDILLNRYELKSLVAPSGTVWIAYDSILDREVAVRYREKPEADEGDASKLDAYMPTIEILRREAQLFARLQHPQILPVHDFGVQGDDPFIVMRYLPGNRTLKTYLQDSVLTVSEILAIANQLASLLDFFREKEVVHGDFSTHNFLLDEQLQPYIFNLVVSSAHTALQEEQPDTIIGSPPYMAPEAFVGEPLTHQADLYAFGVVLYECFANRLPLDGMPLGYAQINAQIGVTQVRAGDG